EKATTAQLRAAMKIPPTFIAEDPKMIKVLFDAWIAAQDPDGKTVLILGPTGTGKEELSKFIHKMSPRAGGPFEFINCAQLNPELADSELFGHYKGGFSGAVYKDTDGLFHRMDGGTLVLDEFADLPDLVQNKLLRTLSPECAQDREIRPVGNKLPHSTLRTKVNTRIICCTSKNLSPLRSDLVHRVTSIQIVIPSLQNRPQDILPLARHFLRAPGLELDKSACDFLLKAQFNGNVRMLRTVVEAAAKTKGKRNILHGSDLKQVYDRIQESNPVEPGPNQSAPNAPSSVGPIRTPQIEKPGSISTLPEAVACLLELQSTGSNWNDLTKSQFESIDMILRGQIFNVLSILVEWGLFRTKDLPELCRYLNGSEKKGRSPEDLVKKLLKLDEKIPNHLAQSPYRKTDNRRLTDLIDEITATKKRK
ncbi:MAG TPA: sigma 54-interacting transcriptional regulator, partial [Acidobacteriota bacterium]|nr:sigma 54-interacting transcriptional regulator [Acidobacteriota bacterium]